MRYMRIHKHIEIFRLKHIRCELLLCVIWSVIVNATWLTGKTKTNGNTTYATWGQDSEKAYHGKVSNKNKERRDGRWPSWKGLTWDWRGFKRSFKEYFATTCMQSVWSSSVWTFYLKRTSWQVSFPRVSWVSNSLMQQQFISSPRLKTLYCIYIQKSSHIPNSIYVHHWC